MINKPTSRDVVSQSDLLLLITSCFCNQDGGGRNTPLRDLDFRNSIVVAFIQFNIEKSFLSVKTEICSVILTNVTQKNTLLLQSGLKLRPCRKRLAVMWGSMRPQEVSDTTNDCEQKNSVCPEISLSE